MTFEDMKQKKVLGIVGRADMADMVTKHNSRAMWFSVRDHQSKIWGTYISDASNFVVDAE